MIGTPESNNAWSTFSFVVLTIWEWVERVVAAFWTSLGWPHAVLIMFFIVVCFFKKEIKDIIKRIKKISADGLEVESPLPQTQPSTKVADLTNPTTGEYPYTFGIIVNLVKNQIEGKSAEEAVQFLLGDNAEWRVLWYFENIYSYIFGGQIKFLEMLNLRGVVGISLAEAEREWADHKERNKPQMDEWEMQPYLNFLIAKDLIVMDGGTYRITLTGKEFLIWMTKCGRSADRLW